MRRHLPFAVHSWALCLATFAAAVGGCSSAPKGPARTAKAVESFRDTREHLADASKQVTATNDSLRVLSEASSGDLRPLFNKFAANVQKTEAAAKEARDRAEAMRKNTDAYVAQWQKEFSTISDEELRRTSEQRVAAAKTEFERVRSAAAEARSAYEPYMQGLKDVQQYLTNDLTAQGVSAIRPKATDTIRKGETLQQRIATVQAEVDALSSKWSSKLGEKAK
jgi:molecular chaperone GrpE (heat shock protein)